MRWKEINEADVVDFGAEKRKRQEPFDPQDLQNQVYNAFAQQEDIEAKTRQAVNKIKEKRAKNLIIPAIYKDYNKDADPVLIWAYNLGELHNTVENKLDIRSEKDQWILEKGMELYPQIVEGIQEKLDALEQVKELANEAFVPKYALQIVEGAAGQYRTALRMLQNVKKAYEKGQAT